LKKEIKSLKSKLNDHTIVELRNISFKEARDEKKWVSSRKDNWYYSDIVEELGIDLEIVLQVVDDLIKDGIRIVEQE